jgi:uncharacterized protein with NRDE domain
VCLILLANDVHPDYQLILAANRDEFYDRPTAPVSFWQEAPAVLAGRDLLGGGSWLGVTRTGKFAVLSNYREPQAHRHNAPSRGKLVSDYLQGELPPAEYLAVVQEQAASYNGFNLIVGDGGGLSYLSNRQGVPQRVSAGIYGLSNHLLDTPWLKVVRGKGMLAALLADGVALEPEACFALLADRSVAPDQLLPDTGVGLELERALSAIFIATPSYGTRASTLVFIDRQNNLTFLERSFGPGGEAGETVRFCFRIEA